jgi:rRNA-processing protein FCF1
MRKKLHTGELSRRSAPGEPGARNRPLRGGSRLSPALGVWNNMKIAIDSNALTYLINAMAPDYDPLNDMPLNKEERQAMLRIFLYQGIPFYILPQVMNEYNAISIYDWRNLHESTVGSLLIEFRITNHENEIAQRRSEFLKYHNKYKDCQLTAEAERSGMDVLLTKDIDLKKNLSGIATISPNS